MKSFHISGDHWWDTPLVVLMCLAFLIFLLTFDLLAMILLGPFTWWQRRRGARP